MSESLKKGDLLIMLHGLGRQATCWHPADRYFSALGAEVKALSYHSRRQSVAASVSEINDQMLPLIQRLQPGQKVHFLTHSLGGILWRKWLPDPLPEWLGRTVMLAPPNQGSLVAAQMIRHSWARWLLGPALQDLQPTPPDTQTPVPFNRVGVIMGDRPAFPFFHRTLGPEPHDGIVRVSEGQISGGADFTVVPEHHTLIMRSRGVCQLAHHFFTHGKFSLPHPTQCTGVNNLQ